MSAIIRNATLIQVFSPPTIIDPMGHDGSTRIAAASTGGDRPPLVPGPTISIRCTFDKPTTFVQREIDREKVNANAVLYVALADLPDAAQQLIKGNEVLVTLDDHPGNFQLRIEYATTAIGPIPHVRALVRNK